MGVPVVYTDFDGVLNAFPDRKVLQRGGVNRTQWLKDGDPRKALYSPERAFHLDGNAQARLFVGRFRIHWSRELSDAMYGLARTGRIELNWLTTWQPYCTNTLDPMLGWDPGIVRTVPWYDPVTMERRLTGKRSTILSRIQAERKSADPSPAIWIDDEECDQAAMAEIRAAEPAAPVLMVRPDWRIGISRRQWRLVNDFIDCWDGFPSVTLDAEDGRHGHGGHIGL